MHSLFIKGGLFMWPLLGLSVLPLVLARPHKGMVLTHT